VRLLIRRNDNDDIVSVVPLPAGCHRSYIERKIRYVIESIDTDLYYVDDSEANADKEMVA